MDFLPRPVRRRVHDALLWALCCALVLIFIYILTIETHIESKLALSKVFLFSQLVFVDFCSCLLKKLHNNLDIFF